jgi:carboxyl-terminal processing protease
MKQIVKLLLIILVIGCTFKKDPLLEEAVSVIESNSIMRDSINWDNFKKDVFKKAETVKTNEDRYKVIQFALKLLNDQHSFFIKPNLTFSEAFSGMSNPICTYKLIDNSVGYINIPSCEGDCTIVKKYVRQITNALIDLDKNQLSGWIIDLRTNEGGNMWPMVLGLSPLIGEGVFGYFVTPEKNYVPWSYRDGIVFNGKDTMMIQDMGCMVKSSNKKIAVLINQTTRSSGEAVAISFKGKNLTRFFGCSTRGVSTANKGFTLSDGSCIVLTVSKMADRTKHVYGYQINPDELSSQCHGDKLIEIATKWICN